MKYAIYLPNFGDEHTPQALAELAQEAEAAGWDGFFLWDHLLFSATEQPNIVDPWISLAAMAAATQTIRLGTTITPVARRHPWMLARQTASLDILANGRLTLGVGLGEPPEEFSYFNEDADPKVRAAKMDEGLEILTGLWKGQPFHYKGHHYRVQEVTFRPTPVQQPRIPIWVGGFWPNPAPFRRAAHWDGVLPLAKNDEWLTPEDIREVRSFVDQHRSSETAYDVALINNWWIPMEDGTQGAKKIERYEAAGVTWWLQALFMERNSKEQLLDQIRYGSPKQ